MTARVLDGRDIAAELWSEIEAEARALLERSGVVPKLAIVRVGDDPASEWYERQISKTFSTHGLAAEATVLPANISQSAVSDALQSLAADTTTHGLLLQLPLPAGLQSQPLVDAIPLPKDVEGLHPYHVGLLTLGRPRFIPSTPLAGVEILRRSGFELAGKLAVIVGRSPVIGRPLASLLVQADCTVVVCHSRTRVLASITRQADILLAAAGQPNLVTEEMVKLGAVVIDFGTSEVNGRLVGDVDFEAAREVAGAITPVPGGTGPVTTALLGRNMLQAAREQLAG
jgi:methylenetetrahydrofolate dehydrogenase (NADP+)/methenyltetrahydrofolate cyclohydrolase